MISVPATSGPRVLTVGENYQYPSIGLAVEAAGPGDNIIVFEGRYREAITLTKPVEILGVGVLTDIVVECSDSRPVLQLASAVHACPPRPLRKRTRRPSILVLTPCI